jgi:hypothetical protein
MQNFKKYLLQEEHNDFWPEQDIREWATDQGHAVLKKYNVQSPHEQGQILNPIITYGKLNCSYVQISSFPECLPLEEETDLRKFPCQFGHISRHFFAGDCDLFSLKGAPTSVEGKFSISGNDNISTLDYFPESASKYILRGTSIASFHRINKIVKKINPSTEDYDHFVLPFSNLGDSFLGFLLIPGCNDIGYSPTATTGELTKYPKFIKAVNIVGRHLQGDKDVLECQEELITNGLRQYAKL